ncbi:hypothetical protein A3D72_00230 [Candidatus Uhrbacteria bacterium RIFCSPHIGHO2_02_FULL_57_19]|uniref:Lactamase n=1 Tax=Candidatus Uhrbacteria bacterium RIFCSPHIGHO2_02_FULL_57_19 TaxID=1802391 RepID=A0A1F7U6L9_9BACT|nr:MAG: hypothetical protein A3D72_00230 [Candidatus Uhrbacteria bacterium RIFCSPHIGHO2_02_FULL_57_19]
MATTVTINWFGLSCVRLVAKFDHDEVTVVSDPYDPSRGAKLPRNLSADILTVSHDHLSHNYVDGVGGTPFIITGPGEYEVKRVFVYGIASEHGGRGKEKSETPNTMYRFEIGDMSFAHLGDLGHELSDAQLDRLEDVDVLFLPVGGAGVTIGAKQATDIVSRVEPRIVIPMHFRLPEFKETLEPVDKFIRELGAPKETAEKLKISKKDLIQEETKVIVLSRA